MRKIIILGLCITLILVSGCIPEEEVAVSYTDYNDVLIKMNISAGKFDSIFKCFDSLEMDYIGTFNHTFFDFYKREKTIITRDITRFFIDYPRLESYYDILDNDGFKKIADNPTDFYCTTNLVDVDDNIAAEIWDEGHKEVKYIRLRERFEIICQKYYGEILCQYKYDYGHVYELDYYRLNDYIKDKIINEAIR